MVAIQNILARTAIPLIALVPEQDYTKEYCLGKRSSGANFRGKIRFGTDSAFCIGEFKTESGVINP